MDGKIGVAASKISSDIPMNDATDDGFDNMAHTADIQGAANPGNAYEGSFTPYTSSNMEDTSGFPTEGIVHTANIEAIANPDNVHDGSPMLYESSDEQGINALPHDDFMNGERDEVFGGDKSDSETVIGDSVNEGPAECDPTHSHVDEDTDQPEPRINTTYGLRPNPVEAVNAVTWEIILDNDTSGFYETNKKKREALDAEWINKKRNINIDLYKKRCDTLAKNRKTRVASLKAVQAGSKKGSNIQEKNFTLVGLENIVADGVKRKAAPTQFCNDSGNEDDYGHEEENHATNQDQQNNILLYCTCRQPEGGDMILCDGPCSDWYHYGCVSVTPEELLKSTYLCPKCRDAVHEGA